jgi:tetratricopeptide (TPR) repeat protein
VRPALLLLIICLLSPLFGNTQNSDAILQYANELMAEKEYGLAIQQFELADDVDHGNIHAKIGIAEALYFLKNYEEALDVIENLGAIGSYPKADYVKAQVYFKIGDYSKARALFRSSLIREVPDDELLYRIAVCNYQLDHLASAVEGLLEFQSTHLDHAYSYYYLGQSYLELDSLDLARSAAVRSTELDALVPRMWRGLADVDFAMGDLDAAVMHYGSALSLNPGYREARLRRGIAYYENGIYGLAKSDLEEASKNNSRDELALNTLLDCYYALNEYDSFLGIVDRLFQINPGASELLFKRGYMHFANSQFEAAIDDFEILADIYPEDNSIHHQLGNCHAQKKDYPSAIHHYKIASQGERAIEESKYNLAVILFESERLPEACELWKNLIENAKDELIKSNSEKYNLEFCQ